MIYRSTSESDQDSDISSNTSDLDEDLFLLELFLKELYQMEIYTKGINGD